jgi:signal transduction histidine kinase
MARPRSSTLAWALYATVLAVAGVSVVLLVPGVRDRLSALAGELEVPSAPGEGTTLVGRLPLPPR